MERRKFVIGLGSLAVGGAAAMGTGAVSQVSSTRAVDVGVVNDAEGVLGLSTSDESLENSEYANYENGSLQLQFNSNADDLNGASGLSPDSVFEFDNVFQISNQGKDDLHVDIDKSNLDNPDAISFYVAYSDGSNIGLESWNTPNIPSGTANNVGVKIETPDNISNSWETGYITITAADESDVNQEEI